MLELANVTFATVNSIVWTGVADKMRAAAHFSEGDHVPKFAAHKLALDRVHTTDDQPDALPVPQASLQAPATAPLRQPTRAFRLLHHSTQLHPSPDLPMTSTLAA